MKIACIIRRLNVRGGVQRHVLSLAHELVAQGHDVTVYTFVLDPIQCFADLLTGVRIVSLDAGGAPSRLPSGVIRRRIAERRREQALAHLIDVGTDILNPHDSVCYRVAAFFKRDVANVPSVWTMHDLPLRALGVLRDRSHAGTPSPWWLRFLRSVADRYDIFRYIRIQDRIVVLDGRDREWVSWYFGREASVVRNGIDLQSFPYVRRRAIARRPVRLLMVGIFLPHRRFEDGIEALAALRERKNDATLMIIGTHRPDDPYYARVRAFIDNRGLRDRVNFRGSVSDEELRAAYEGHDIFLFPNHLQSWGLAVFEAMARGMPVIVSRSTGASEVLTDGRDALIVPPESPADIAVAIRRLLDHPELYESLSRNGRRFVEEHISWRKVAAVMEGIFKEELQKRRTL